MSRKARNKRAAGCFLKNFGETPGVCLCVIKEEDSHVVW